MLRSAELAAQRLEAVRLAAPAKAEMRGDEQAEASNIQRVDAGAAGGVECRISENECKVIDCFFVVFVFLIDCFRVMRDSMQRRFFFLVNI